MNANSYFIRVCFCFTLDVSPFLKNNMIAFTVFIDF
ncbi:hypothetical protein K710_0502 [Streptococcus iniae SF1]|nr:hypothetical protein K710_0502 [Streptococcus iniae SF1]